LNILKEYSKNIFPKVVTKAIKKQAGAARVIPFAPFKVMECSFALIKK
jgi:hypothetical protein